jgi:hypothetical protein
MTFTARALLVALVNVCLSFVAMSAQAQGVCRLWGDPHIRSFDSRDVHGQFVGIFRYFKTNNVAAQVAQQPFSTGSVVAAVRAIAVRNATSTVAFALAPTLDGGGDVSVTLYADGAPGTPWVVGSTYNSADGSITAVRPPNEPLDTTIVIDDGSEFRLSFLGSANGTLMNVRAILAQSNMGTTSGLCGTWNGRASDELMMSEGVLPRGPRTTAVAAFAKSWRLEGCSDEVIFPPEIPDPYDPGFVPLDPETLDPVCVKAALVACKASGVTPDFAKACSQDACALNDQAFAIAVALNAQEP